MESFDTKTIGTRFNTGFKIAVLKGFYVMKTFELL